MMWRRLPANAPWPRPFCRSRIRSCADLRFPHSLCNITEPDRSPISVGDNQRGILFRFEQLVGVHSRSTVGLIFQIPFGVFAFADRSAARTSSKHPVVRQCVRIQVPREPLVSLPQRCDQSYPNRPGISFAQERNHTNHKTASGNRVR